MSEPRRLRVLWLSNGLLEPTDRGASGTWLHAMAAALVESGRVELGNITTGRVGALTRADHNTVQQWIVPPARSHGRDGLPADAIVRDYLAAIEAFDPDLVHVWGAETFPGLLTARGLVRRPALLEIQGLKGPLADLYAAGLTLVQQAQCVGPKELVRRSTIPQEAAFYRRWGRFEDEIIAGHRFVTAPSPWMAAHVRAANRDARLFHNEIPLRRELLACEPWAAHGQPILYSSASYTVPYKGLHTLVRAGRILVREFPDLRIRIAGPHQSPGLRRSGYMRWLNREIRAAGLEAHIDWLGAIGGDRVCEELRGCSVAVFPSYAESYGVAHAEAMQVGTPCVLAYNGGSSYLADPGRTGLFFPPGDDAVCAAQVTALLRDRELAGALSRKGREVATGRHDQATIVARQLEIYERVRDEAGPRAP